jgi:hypothetical protein
MPPQRGRRQRIRCGLSPRGGRTRKTINPAAISAGHDRA